MVVMKPAAKQWPGRSAMVGMGYLYRSHFCQMSGSLLSLWISSENICTSIAASIADTNSRPRTSPLPERHSRSLIHCCRILKSRMSSLQHPSESGGPVYRARVAVSCRMKGSCDYRGVIQMLGDRGGWRVECCDRQWMVSMDVLSLEPELGELYKGWSCNPPTLTRHA